MSEVKINVDLDLDTKLAKGQLDDFKKIVEKDKIPVKLDIENVKGEAVALKNVLSDAFKMDNATLGNLKQVENSLKEINKLLKHQKSLSSESGTSNALGVNPITINKNADIVKDTSILVDDYKKATSQLEELDIYGKEIKNILNKFNSDQEEAFKKFSNDSKSYDNYLNELSNGNMTSSLKKAIEASKKSIQLQEELTKLGVVKVNNDQLRNETSDGSIFTIENEKWKAMFARSESEAKDLEDMARKLQPKIKAANDSVSELVEKMSEDERKLLNDISKAYSERPKFDGLDSNNSNANYLKLLLENLMPDVDKIGLDFNNLDDILRGVDRYYSRLEQMQREYNNKFSGEDGFRASNLESLLGIDQEELQRVTNDLRQQQDVFEQLFRGMNRVSSESGNVNLPFEVETNDINNLREYVRLSELLSRTNSNSNRENSSSSESRLARTIEKLEDIQRRLNNMQNARGFLDNDLLERTNNLLSDTRNSLDANGIESDFEQVNATVRELGRNLQDLSAGNTLSRQEAGFNASLESMSNRLESFRDSIQGLRGSDDIIERLESSFRNIDSTNIERATIELRQFGNELNQAQREACQLESSMGRSFFGNFGQEFRENLFTFTAGELLADGIRNIGYSLKTLVMEYDSAFTNLKKVANPEDVMNISQLDAIEKKAVDIAKNVGQSSQDTIQAIADTIQMAGLGMEESILVAEQTMKLANVAEMTQQAASEGVVTMLSAFNLDPLKEIPLVVDGVTQSTNEMVNAFDMINHVGNNYAVSSEGILDAITSGANVLASYNVGMEDTIAMIGAANTTLQDTSRVGNGLKTIAVNLAGIKASADTGELSLNKTAMALSKVAGIDIFANKKTNQLKGMSTIIEELALKWKDFDDVQRAGISEAIAGKQQAAVFQSLMSNFKTMKEIQGELTNGEHWQSMEKENAQYVDSLAGQLNKLKETWVGIFNTIFNSDAAKSIIKGLVSISEAIAKVITTLDEVGMLTPVLAGLGIMLGKKVFAGLPNLFGGASDSVSGLTSALLNMTPPVTRLGGAMVSTGTRVVGLSASMSSFIAGAAPFIPWAIAAAGVTYTLVKAYDYFNESLDEEKQRLNESIDTRQKEIDSINEQKKSLSEIADEYDKLKDKPNKTNEEVERLKDLTNEIAQIMPSLIVGYDENGNAIINMTGDVKTLIEELDKATQSKQRLMDVEKSELAENAVKQLHGNSNLDSTSIKGMSSNANSEMSKLESTTLEHIDKMAKLEKKRDNLVNKLYGTTGKERQQTLKDIDKANYEIERQQSEFVQKYQSQLDIIKEYSNTIGEGAFTNIANGSIFANSSKEKQDHFLDLKNVLDFSDINTEDKLLEVEMSLSRLLKVANDGKIDIKGLENSITDINNEFARTGDFDKYEESMEKLSSSISGLTGIDVNILKDLFIGIDTSVTKSKDSLDKFLESFGKTRGDLLNGDAFAQALANQHRVIQSAIDDLSNITGDNEIDIELAYNIVNNNELPSQLRDMVRTLVNKGFDTGKILKISEKILIDLQDGEVDVSQIQFMLDQAFGQGAFEVSPELLLNPNAKLAGVENVVNSIKEKYGEIPSEIETIIRADGITSILESERILSLYNTFPDEIKTIITSNGYDTLKDLELIQQLFVSLPPEQAMTIVTNYSDVIKDSENLDEVLGKLSKTPIKIEPVVQSEEATNALNNLLNKPVKDVVVGIKGDNADANKKAEDTDTKVNDIKQDAPTKIEVDNISANNRLKTTKTHLDEIKSKTVTVTVNTVDRSSGSGISSNTWDTQSVSTHTVMRSVIDNPNEIALLSDNGASETVANTSVENLNVRARAKNPISGIDSVNYSVNTFKKLEEQLKKISNELRIIGEKAEGAFGTQKIAYLNQQINLYKKQQELQHQLAEGMRQQASELKVYIQQRGVQVSSDGQVLNYSEKMLAIEKEIKALRDADTNNKNNSNSNSTKIEELEKLKKSLEEYISLTNDKIPSASATWWDLENAIKKARAEAVKAEIAMKNINASIDIGKYNTSLNAVRREINRLDEDIERAFGQDKEELLKKKIELIQREQDELHKLAEAYRSQAKTYKDYLANKGFVFNERGDITNLEQIKKHMDADEFEAIKDILEDYIGLTQNTIPNLSEDWWDLQDAIDSANQAIKDSQKEQLETTKKVQDQIMDMYRKQAEEKKKLIDEELKKKLDALSKEQKAYNDARNQQKYEDNYNDQLKTVMDMEKQLALLSKDTSLSGQKKYQELLKQLQEEQKKLEEIVQDKIDSDINSMYDSESERLQEEADKIKEEVDGAYSDEKLQELVDKTLNTGMFETINGELISLNDAMLVYIDKYEDGMSAIGSIIKDEWLSSLDIAKDTMRDMAEILANLDLGKISSSMMSFAAPQVRFAEPNYSSYSGNVDISSPLIVVEGNVDKDVMGDLKSFGIKLKDDIINTIYKASR